MKKTELHIKLLNFKRELKDLESAYDMTETNSIKISISNKIIALKQKIYLTSLYI